MHAPNPPMKLSCWNCRGLAQPAVARSLRAPEKKHCPDIVFLLETKLSFSSPLLVLLGFVNFVEWLAIGTKGGLILAWKNGCDVEITACRENFISAVISSNLPQLPWMFTEVYAPTEWHKKELFWRHLAANSDSFNGLWLCVGDFNSILSIEDKNWR